jgi:hypothetical protein
MCAGGDIMDNTISEAAQILQRISNGQRTQQDWQRRCREEQNDKSKSKVLAEISEKDEPEVKKDEPTIQEIKEPLPKVIEVISDVKNVETNMNVGRSMWNARPLTEFNQSGWVQVEEKSESMMRDLGDMWYTRDKESNIQDFEDEDWDDNEDFKEETNANEVDGLHVPHDEIEGVQKGNKETPSLVEIDSPSTPLDEPNITLVEKALRPRYVLKSQNIIGIDGDKFKYSCSTNSMNDSLNSMPCSNNDHVDRLDFLENEKEKTFIFDPINLTPKEPFPNYELSAIHETYASFIYTLTCCYNSDVVLIMDAYVYNKFCKSRSCFALGQANDLKEAHVRRRPDFH